MEMIRRKYRGSTAVTSAALILFTMMLLIVTLQVWQCFSVIEQSKNNIERAVLATASVNVSKIFAGIRESEGSVREYYLYNWLIGQNIIGQDEIEAYLTSKLVLVKQGDVFRKKDSEQNLIYEISKLSVTHDNAPLNFTATFKLRIPLHFLDSEFFVTPSVLVHCKYQPKF